MAWSLHSGWSYGWALLLAFPAAGLYVRLFAAPARLRHGSQPLREPVGRRMSRLISCFLCHWKKTHAVHHGTSGNLDRRERWRQ